MFEAIGLARLKDEQLLALCKQKNSYSNTENQVGFEPKLK